MLPCHNLTKQANSFEQNNKIEENKNKNCVYVLEKWIAEQKQKSGFDEEASKHAILIIALGYARAGKLGRVPNDRFVYLS